MPPTKAQFSLCETNVAIFREIMDNYGIDDSWLAWQYEKYAITSGSTPFCITTQEYHAPNGIKEGVDKVSFEIDFSLENPNLISCIRFREMPSKKHFIITQTSILHVQESTTCCLWFELPRRALKQDISAVQSLVKVKICCDAWKDFLPASPLTELERAQLIIAQDDIAWVKNQLVLRDSALLRIKGDMAFKSIEMKTVKDSNEKLLQERVALKAEIESYQSRLEKIQAELDEKDALLNEFASPTSKARGGSKKRKTMTLKSRFPSTPNTFPRIAKAGDSSYLATPTKRGNNFLGSFGGATTP